MQQTAIETTKPAPSAGGDAELIRLAGVFNPIFQRALKRYQDAETASENGASFEEIEAIEEDAVAIHREAIPHAMDALAIEPEGWPGAVALADAYVVYLGHEDELKNVEVHFPDDPEEGRFLFNIVRAVRRLRPDSAPTISTPSA